VAYLFVIGSGRCGSTLVHRVLAGHPDVGWISAADDRLRGFGPKGRLNRRLWLAPGATMPEFVRERYQPSEAYRLLADCVSPMLSTPCRDLTAADATPWLSERFARFFEERAAAQGTPVFLHKFTGWPRAGLVHAVLPEARFLHVVRDGRAVANSLLQMPWWHGFGGPESWTFGDLPDEYRQEWEESGRSYPVLAGLEWKILMDAAAKAREAVPGVQWLEVRYEDLVAQPREWFLRILEFVGLSWNDRFGMAYSSHDIRSGRSDAYRQELRPEDVKQLDRVLGGHLERLGYPVTS
jgi:hypothetical protein